MLAGVLLALATFTISALLASLTCTRSAALDLAVQLGGFIMRLGLVAAALFVCVRFLHLQPVPLGIGLAGTFTVLTVLAAARELRRHKIGWARH